MKDALGDRMKLYEGAEAGRRFMPLIPIIGRVDGRSFHSFTRGMDRPFDERFHAAMLETTIYLVKHTGACMGYHQSDEITLAWYSSNPKSSVWFDGRIAKMTSQLGAQTTLAFYRSITKLMPEYMDRCPTFDARVWQVPTLNEGANAFLWREQDATRNSVSSVAQSAYSHKQLMHKNETHKLDMLIEAGINWSDYPAHLKRGRYVQRRKVERAFTTEEVEKLPPKHDAHRNPSLTVLRSDVVALDMPPLGRVVNRADVIFLGVDPIVEEPTP